MRPEPDLGTPPEVEPAQDNGQWQVPGQGSATKFGPFQDHPILPKERTLKAKTKTKTKYIYICRASARPPASQSTVPYFTSSLDGIRNQKA